MNDIDRSDLDRRLNSLASPDAIPGLAFLKSLFRALDFKADFPAIHVAGTNGKGSTCKTLMTVLENSGYKTALYTSPHLVSARERLLIGGRMLPMEEWNGVIDRIAGFMHETGTKAGYFQIATAAAFMLIARYHVDIAVIEVGVGGRCDPTNILAAPVLSVITPLGMDHMHMLGNTMEKIAENKFGIIRSGGKALYAGGTSELDKQFLKHCAGIKADGYIFRNMSAVSDIRSGLDGNTFSLKTEGEKYTIHTPLVGLHQVQNAGMAFCALSLISDDFPVTPQQFAEGVEHTEWPCRMEVLQRHPDVILDGAHNPHGVRALTESLLAVYGADEPLTFICASMEDKAYAESLQILAETFKNAGLICSAVPEISRSASSGSLLHVAEKCGWNGRVQEASSPAGALRLGYAGKRNMIICGSLYFTGLLRGELLNEKQ